MLQWFFFFFPYFTLFGLNQKEKNCIALLSTATYYPTIVSFFPFFCSFWFKLNNDRQIVNTLGKRHQLKQSMEKSDGTLQLPVIDLSSSDRISTAQSIRQVPSHRTS